MRSALRPLRRHQRADIGPFFQALRENQERNYRELQEAIEYVKTQNGLLATMERVSSLIAEQVLKDVLSSRKLTVSCSSPMRS